MMCPQMSCPKFLVGVTCWVKHWIFSRWTHLDESIAQGLKDLHLGSQGQIELSFENQKNILRTDPPKTSPLR